MRSGDCCNEGSDRCNESTINVFLNGKMIMESCLFQDVKHVVIVDNEMCVPYRSKNVA